MLPSCLHQCEQKPHFTVWAWLPQDPEVDSPKRTRRYLHAVRVVQEWGLLHPEVVGDQSVEAIGEIQDLRVTAALGHGLEEWGGMSQG